MAAEDLLTPEELADAKLADMTDDERAALAELADEDDPEGDGAADTAADGHPAANAGAADDAGDKAAEDGEDGEGRPEIDPTFAPHFDAGDPAQIDAQLKALRDERAALKTKWRAGEMDDEEFDRSEALLEERKDTLIQERAQAVTAANLSRESSVQAFERDKQNFLRTMDKYEGVAYSKPMLAAAFENELRAAGKRALDEKRDPSATELFEEAHAKVIEQLTALGVTVGKKVKPTEAPEKPAGKAAEAKQDPPRIPTTLGGLPAAAPNTAASDDLAAQAAQLDGEDLELFIAKLPADKRRALDAAA